MHPALLTDDAIRRADQICYVTADQVPIDIGTTPALIFFAPAKPEMSPGIHRRVSYVIVIDSWKQLWEKRAQIIAVRGKGGTVGRDERREVLESLDLTGREQVYRHRLGIPAMVKADALPRRWIDLVLDVEYGTGRTS